jgi:hypothetical protein
MMRRFCMFGRQQAERHLRDLGPGDALAVAERRVDDVISR